MLEILAAIIAIFIAILYYLISADKKVPPGPISLPFIGYWPFLKNDNLHLQLDAMAKKYGDICSLRVTGTLYIVLSSIKAVREAHIAKSECFNERCLSYSLFRHVLNDGVIFTTYEKWKVLRKFFLLNLRNYGLTSMKNKLAETMQDSLSEIIQQLKKKDGEIVEMDQLLEKGCMQMMQNLLFPGMMLAEDVQTDLIANFLEVFKDINDKKMLATGPVAKYFILPLVFDYKKFRQIHLELESILFKIVEDHKNTLDENNPRNILDLFYIQKNLMKAKSDPATKYFTDKALVGTLIQLIGDASISVIAFIASILLDLVNNPDEQEKMYEEIIAVVGHNREPTIEDKSRLPYTNAVINESLRLGNFFSVFPSLECTTETEVCGYRIPKGSITLINMWSAHHDPSVYKDPYTFNPMRFISKPNESKEELPSVFGIGKRSCIGEAFAMNQTFIYITTIIKSFKLALPQTQNYVQLKLGDDIICRVCVHLREKE